MRLSIAAALAACWLLGCGGDVVLGDASDGGPDSVEVDGETHDSTTDGDVTSPGIDSSSDTTTFDVGAADSFPVESGPPACSVATCPSGCCGGSGCTAGTSTTACGFGGQACTDCTKIGLECVPASGGGTGGACGSLDAGPGPDGEAPCGPANCVGCCAGDVCVPGTANDDCGSHGLACEQCKGSNVSCTPLSGAGGACVGTGSGCSPTTCPAGCCDSSGLCQDPSAIGACGSGGVACQFCLPGQACNAGRCQAVPGCGPANCAGCCKGSTCLSGSGDNSACGSGGQACQACTSGACYPLGAKQGGVCTNDMGCGPGTCPNGCCDGYLQCHPSSDTYCPGGVDGGGPCGTCGGSCATGACIGGSFCNASNCNGCCQPDGTCWTGGLDSAHCGGDGHFCFDCGPGYVCSTSSGMGFACVVACSPQNCQGCCVGGVCSTGTDPTSCGVGGEVCAQCGQGQSCVNGACLTLTQCGATACAGCCDGNDVCHTGTSDTQCGTGGAACVDCAAGSRTCKAGACSP